MSHLVLGELFHGKHGNSRPFIEHIALLPIPLGVSLVDFLAHRDISAINADDPAYDGKYDLIVLSNGSIGRCP